MIPIEDMWLAFALAAIGTSLFGIWTYFRLKK